MSTDAAAAASVTVPALSAVVYRADAPVTAPASPLAVTVSAPAAGAALSGSVPVTADVDDATWTETSFAWRVVGSDEWHALGTAEDTEPRVFHEPKDLADGTLVEYRAVTTDASGAHAAASTYGSIGNAVSLVVPEEPESPIDMVTVAGDLNSEMGCAGDWTPGCEAAKLTLRADGIWSGTFDLPAKTYEYKVAINGSWDVNYGANGVPGGGNIKITHAGGPITFYFDPRIEHRAVVRRGPHRDAARLVPVRGGMPERLGARLPQEPARRRRQGRRVRADPRPAGRRLRDARPPTA